MPALLLTLLMPAAAVHSAEPTGFLLGIDAGYSAGLGAQLSGTLANFTTTVPLSLRLGFGYFVRDPGNPYDARAIFINDNTNGTPEKSGSMWQYRFDLLFPVAHLGPQVLDLAFGVRHARYKANFKYIGGNEDFDVTGNPWSLGAGLETGFATGARSAFVIKLGVDYYFDATLKGHDTSYSPSGDHVNPRHDYTYEDAHKAANPPGGVEPVAVVGWRTGF